MILFSSAFTLLIFEIFLRAVHYNYSPLDNVLIKLKIGQFVLSILDKFGSTKKQDLNFRVGPEDYRSNLNEIISIAKTRGSKVILLTRPYIGESTDETYWKTYAPFYYNITKEVAENNQVPLIDFYSYFKNKKEYFADESHLTDQGHRIAAKIIYENIKTLLY